MIVRHIARAASSSRLIQLSLTTTTTSQIADNPGDSHHDCDTADGSSDSDDLPNSPELGYSDGNNIDIYADMANAEVLLRIQQKLSTKLINNLWITSENVRQWLNEVGPPVDIDETLLSHWPEELRIGMRQCIQRYHERHAQLISRRAMRALEEKPRK